MEVRAEGSRRGFSKLGTTRNRQSLPIRFPHGKHQKCYRTDKSRERRSRPPPALKRTSRISAPTIHPSYHTNLTTRGEHTTRGYQPQPPR